MSLCLESFVPLAVLAHRCIVAMPHPPSPDELTGLDFEEDLEASRYICCNCGQTRGDLMARSHNGDVRCLCQFCFLIIDLLKLSKEFHTDDPVMVAAEERLRDLHSTLRTWVNWRAHEQVLRQFDIEDDDDDDDAWEFESHGISSQPRGDQIEIGNDGDQAREEPIEIGRDGDQGEWL